MAIETSSSKPLVEGLRPADPFLETYWVRPGGATVVALGPDDRITITDVDGGQPAEVTALAPDGTPAAAALGAAADAPATVLRSLVASAAAGASDVVTDLARRGLDPTNAMATLLFDEWGAAGASTSFVTDRDVVIVVAGAGGACHRRRSPTLGPGRSRSGARSPARTTRWSCRRRSPSRVSTSASTGPPPSRTR